MPTVHNIILLLLVIVIAGCAPEPKPHNVLLLMVDALRADHLGCYGYERDTSPRIDALANESVLFLNAYAQSPWTKPSIPTLFTSLYPIQHGVYEGEKPDSAGYLESDVLADEFLTLAEAFKQAGFRTAAFVNNAHLPASQGFAQGFDLYEHGDLSAAEIQQGFLEFTDREPAAPFFAYLHYLDVHWPFEPEPPFDERFGSAEAAAFPGPDGWRGLRDAINQGRISLSPEEHQQLVALHDGGIAELDHHIGRLLERLRQQGRLDQTIIMLTSDHGEELLEHGKVGHGGTLFDEVIRVPMLIRLPGGAGARRVREPARLLDVYPTLLEAAGIPIPPQLVGRDLLAASNRTPEIVAETRHKGTYRVSLRRGDWKYIRTYRASKRARLQANGPDTFGLRAGMRVKVKGRFTLDGALLARKVSLKDGRDDDVEVSGPVSRLDPETKGFHVHSFRVVPSAELMAPRGGGVLETLRADEWVKVEGNVASDGTLVADKLERLSGKDAETELEGIIQQITVASGGSARVTIGSASVVLTRDTRIKGIEAPTPAAAASPVDQDADPFAPQQLLTGKGLSVEESLFDLSNDPGEEVNLMSEENERAARLGRELMLWFERMAGTAGPERGPRERLDDKTIEQLRTLGYVE